MILQSAAGFAGGTIRKSLFVVPPLRVLDTLGGGVLGAAAGVALVWVLGAAALHVPGQTELRRLAQESRILTRLNEEVPPSRLLDAIARVDPFGAIGGPLADVPEPDAKPPLGGAVRAAQGSVVRIVGTACGLGVQGSGWIAGRELVVTNAHVVAGVRDLRVDRRDRRFRGRAPSSSTRATTSPCSGCPVSPVRRCSLPSRVRARRWRSSAIRRTGR